MKLDEALAVARYYGSSVNKTIDEMRCYNEALRVIHVEAKKAFDRFQADAEVTR